MPAAASTSAVRSERCGETATSKPSARSRRAVPSQPSAPRSAPRLSSTSTWSMSGCPATGGTASGRTRSARRRGTSRRRSAETSGVVRTTSPRKLVCTTSSAGPRASCEAAGFIDQHDRDVVLDRILELAARAHEPVPRRGERDLALALRAGEDLEQLLADGHGTPLLPLPRSVNPRRIQLAVAAGCALDACAAGGDGVARRSPSAPGRRTVRPPGVRNRHKKGVSGPWRGDCHPANWVAGRPASSPLTTRAPNSRGHRLSACADRAFRPGAEAGCMLKRRPSALSTAGLAAIAILRALLPRPAAATSSFIQGVAFSTPRIPSTTVTLTHPVAQGDLLVGWFSQYNAPGEIQVSDNVNGTWTRVAAGALTFDDDTGDIALYYRENSRAAPGGITVAVSASASAYLGGAVADYSGVALAGSLARVAAAHGMREGSSTPLRPRRWMQASSCSRPCLPTPL